MAGKDNAPEEEIDPNAWMATFSDLLSLLLTFFVLLFAMKSVDEGKLEETLGHFRRGGIGILESGIFMPLIKDRSPEVKEQFVPVSSDDLKKALRRKDLDEKVSVTAERKGLVVALPGTLLFDSGTADLNSGANEVLAEIIDLLEMTDFNFQLTGHTDDLPLSGTRYASNWELSIARAGKVLRVLIDLGGIAPERFSLVGYGASRPNFPNNTPENRAANRRVEIVLLR
ncbi:MAG: flagellar motor protein MotB [Nitrospiria bacterium]